MKSRMRSMKSRIEAVAAALAEARAAQERRKWWAGPQISGEHERAKETAREAARLEAEMEREGL